MAWTNVNKPTGTSYSTDNPAGRELYDDSSVFFDDSDAFYDGVNTSQYTNINKPTSSVWTSVAKPI